MPESSESSESESKEEQEGPGHSHYQDGYSWNDRNKWGAYGCSGYRGQGYGNGCQGGYQYGGQRALWMGQGFDNNGVKVVYKKKYGGNAHGNSAFQH